MEKREDHKIFQNWKYICNSSNNRFIIIDSTFKPLLHLCVLQSSLWLEQTYNFDRSTKRENTLMKSSLKVLAFRTSLVAKWLRIRLPMQGTRVQALVREDPTCHGATKPVRHNWWACTLELMSHNYGAHVPQLLKPTRLEPVLCNKRSHRNEKHTHCNEEWPPLTAAGGSPRAATNTRQSQK